MKTWSQAALGWFVPVVLQFRMPQNLWKPPGNHTLQERIHLHDIFLKLSCQESNITLFPKSPSDYQDLLLCSHTLHNRWIFCDVYLLLDCPALEEVQEVIVQLEKKMTKPLAYPQSSLSLWRSVALYLKIPFLLYPTLFERKNVSLRTGQTIFLSLFQRREIFWSVSIVVVLHW